MYQVQLIENKGKYELSVQDVFGEKLKNEWKEGIDERVEYAADNIDAWISGLDKEDEDIIAGLLERFQYYSKQQISEILKDLNQRIIDKYQVSNDDSVISVVRKRDGKMNSSHEYWLMHREISNLSKALYRDSLRTITDIQWEGIEKIVFVDDCSGTGQQFTKFLDMVEDEFSASAKTLKGKKIILMVMHIISDALAYIDKYAKDKGYTIYVEYFRCDNKAFFCCDNNEKERFKRLSKARKVKCICGFQDAEGLMAFYNNSPNDTLGIFWCGTDSNKAIFPREDVPKAGWETLNNQKTERDNQRYESKAR